jgi:hypothetical protein
MSVIARSVSDEAISAENKDCFAPLAMTFQLNFTALRQRGPTEAEQLAGGFLPSDMLLRGFSDSY